jgi:hypothetical protein
MRSFIFAVFLLSAVTVFTAINAVQTVRRIDEMLALADTLPKNEEEFSSAEDIDKNVLALIELWDREFPAIAFTAGYDNTNRCDEAIGALEVHFRNNNGADFSVALSEFCDGISRLRILEGFRLEGIF